MVIDSTLKCVQTYETAVGAVNIVPGRNLIPDDQGRALMEFKPFQDMLKTKAIGFRNTIQVIVPPADGPIKAKDGKPAAEFPDGETAVSGMSVKDAVEVINECKVVDQLQDIINRDTRVGVKKAATARIATLAAEAESEKGDGDGDDDDDDDDGVDTHENK